MNKLMPETKKRCRLPVFIVACVFLLCSLIFCCLTCMALFDISNIEPESDATLEEGVGTMIGIVLAVVFLLIADMASATVALILYIVSAFSSVKWIRFMSIAMVLISVLSAVFPIIYGNIMP